MTRAEKVALIRRTLADHPDWTQAQASRAIGMSQSTLRNLLSDPDGAKQAERRKRYQGRCAVCGKPTDGSGGYKYAPSYCAAHIYGSPEYLANVTVWTADILIARIQEWAALYGEPPASNDWNSWQARVALGDEARARRFENDDHWPWFTTVVQRFGSWNAAIRQAGFEPRAPHGGDGNQEHRRDGWLAAA